MSRVVYRVSRPGLERLRVEASIVPGAAVSVLSMRENYGPARGFASGVSNLAVAGAEARAAIQPGRLLVASSAPFTLSYDCVLPAYESAVSLLRGFRRGGVLFCPGMAMFHRLHDEQTEYAVTVANVAGSFAASTSSPTSEDASSHGAVFAPLRPFSIAERKTAASAGNGCFRYTNAAELDRSYFTFGDAVIRAAERACFVHEPDFPFAVDDLLERWPPLAQETGRIFGDDGIADYTVFLFASDEHPPGRPGVGYSLPRGALVSVSARDEVLASPHTLWLLLHESAHQRLGEAIGRADPADDWFFEGFANFAACEALKRAGLLSLASLAGLQSLSRRAINHARFSGESALAHQGFLCAQRWNGLLARRGGSLGDVLTALVASHRGETLRGEVLLAALSQASPDGKIPQFVSRLAAAATPSIPGD